MYVFRAGLYCAVVFVIAHTINIMGAGGEEGRLVDLVGACFESPRPPLQRGSLSHEAVEIGHGLLKFGAVGLGVVVLVEQFGEHEVGVMAVVFRGRAGIETGNEARQGGVGLLPHQAVDGQQFGRRRFGRLNDLDR